MINNLCLKKYPLPFIDRRIINVLKTENKEGQDRNQGDRRSRGPLHEHSRRKEVVKMRRGRRKW